MRKPYCDACKCESELKTGREIYPRRPDLSWVKVYECGGCKRRVGCHRGTIKPLGTLSTDEERKARMSAHKEFDPLWKNGSISRSQAYAELSDYLGLSKEKTHIGMFDVETCQRVVDFSKKQKENANE